MPSITVGPSPFTYIAGATAEIVTVEGGSVSAIAQNGVDLTTGLPLNVYLPPGGSVTVTYTSTPDMSYVEGGGLSGSYGHTFEPPLSGSPYSYTAGLITGSGASEVIYISDGVVMSIKQNGIDIADALPFSMVLALGDTIVVDYTEEPLFVVTFRSASPPDPPDPPDICESISPPVYTPRLECYLEPSELTGS